MLCFLLICNECSSQVIYVDNVNDKRFISYRDSLKEQLKSIRYEKECNDVVKFHKLVKTEKDFKLFCKKYGINNPTVSNSDKKQKSKSNSQLFLVKVIIEEKEDCNCLIPKHTIYTHIITRDKYIDYTPKITVYIKQKQPLKKEVYVANNEESKKDTIKFLTVIHKIHNLNTNNIRTVDSVRYKFKSKYNDGKN